MLNIQREKELNLPHYHPSRQDFSIYNKRAIDEAWYKRAVEHHFIESSSFVYSVQFNASENIAEKNDTLVTASHAVYHTEGGKKAPAAVIGFQFKHSALVTLLQNITSQCLDGPCTKTCSSEEFDCFVLDDHGYVVVGAKLEDTGKFFGEVRRTLLVNLVWNINLVHFAGARVDDAALCRGQHLQGGPDLRLSGSVLHGEGLQELGAHFATGERKLTH